MPANLLVRGDMLYHSVHGLCKVNEVLKKKESGKEVVYYGIVPDMANEMKIRYLVPEDGLSASGFRLPVTAEEANQILKYLREGQVAAVPVGAVEERDVRSFAERNETWALAESILNLAHDQTNSASKQRKRELLLRASRGLIRELSFAFRIPVKEAADRVKKSLSRTNGTNALVLAALTSAVED